MPFTVAFMVVSIVLISMIGKVLTARYRALGEQQHRTVESADTMRLREEVRNMRERIQVLERVITDNHQSTDLDREIERLRDR
ncbi:cell division protein FtsB [Sphingomonas jinjuensis]|uniref:Cell division protein FtsB n=1 Tax=Sphingomonas jinjuensis TaxID=535907 RepID=A0A840F8H9_9SPHN|nr:hypothetical protein [Sphingomonas jinjuensis]MBB4152841.1 cell division protein FtsB [Sphingomonas jinjuensis]